MFSEHFYGIQDIPMINPHNLEGVGWEIKMSSEHFIDIKKDPVHASFKFLGEYNADYEILFNRGEI